MNMSLKKYYDILELSQDADFKQIKKQYRKLALRYHPDKNKSNEAAFRFNLITEAYQILIHRQDAPIEKQHLNRREERYEKALKQKAAQELKEKIENENYYKGLFTGFKWFFIKFSTLLGLLLCLALVIDMIIPTSHTEKLELTNIRKNVYSAGRGHRISVLEMRDNSYVWFTGTDDHFIQNSDNVFIEKSWLFHFPLQVFSIDRSGIHFYLVFFNQLKFSVIAILLLMIPFFVIFRKSRTVYYSFIYLFTLYVICPLMYCFLIYDQRWFHFVTLGFY